MMRPRPANFAQLAKKVDSLKLYYMCSSVKFRHCSRQICISLKDSEAYVGCAYMVNCFAPGKTTCSNPDGWNQE